MKCYQNAKLTIRFQRKRSILVDLSNNIEKGKTTYKERNKKCKDKLHKQESFVFIVLLSKQI